jgi:hypothetical protein
MCAPGSNRIITDSKSCGEAKVQSVSVKGTPVVEDREDDDPLTIDEEKKGKCDSGATQAEWVDCPTPDGTADRIWPVVVTRNKPLVFSQVRLQGLHVPLTDPPHPRLLGTVDVGSTTLTVSGTGTVEPGTEPDTATLVVKDVISTKPLPETVGFQKATIHWQIRIDPVKESTSSDAGTSTIPLYIVYSDPINTVPNAPEMYLSTVDIASKAADGATDEGSIVSSVWQAFKSLHVQPRKLDPSTGDVTVSQTVLKYWEPWSVSAYITDTWRPLCPGVHGPLPVLRDGVGRCGTWADFFVAALNSQGISAQTVKVSEEKGFPCGPICDQTKEWMLIKDWTFLKPTASGPFPYQAVYLLKQQGSSKSATRVKTEFRYPSQSKGQGGTTPPPGMFVVGDHEIVRYTVPSGGPGVLYDPSYGTGPFTDIQQWAKVSIAGYMTVNQYNHGTNQWRIVLRAHKGSCQTPCKG